MSLPPLVPPLNQRILGPFHPEPPRQPTDGGNPGEDASVWPRGRSRRQARPTHPPSRIEEPVPVARDAPARTRGAIANLLIA